MRILYRINSVFQSTNRGNDSQNIVEENRIGQEYLLQTPISEVEHHLLFPIAYKPTWQNSAL